MTTFAICTCHLYIESIKVYSITGLDRSLGLLKAEDPRISIQSAHEGAYVLSQNTGRLYPLPLPGDAPGTHFC
jgi:hypothetical protein